jgi:hypothetical protein
MSYHCFKCNREFLLSGGQRIGRRESCGSCGSDLHVCRNCSHHDRSAYNECREPQAERVLDKERSNMCDYFTPRSGGASATGEKQKGDHLKSLEDLFKK